MRNARALWYDVLGRRVVVRAPPPVRELLLDLDHPWTRFRTRSGGRPHVEIDVLVHAPPAPLRHVQDFANARFFVHGSRSCLITGSCHVRPWQVHVQSWLDDPFLVVHAMLVPVLLDLLERFGFVTLHAAALAHRGGGVLLAGDTGRGKSATSWALLRGGFDFIGDNELYLQRRAGALVVRGLRRELRLGATAWDVLPGLPPRSTVPLAGPPGRRKRSLDVARLFPGRVRGAVTVRLLLFPRIRGGGSRVARLTSVEALSRLLRSYPVGGSLRAVLKDAPAVQSRFEVLAALASQVPAYRLDLGSDVARLPALIRSLL
jgi:hypothetical protein